MDAIRPEETLRAAVLAAAEAGGEALFAELARFLARTLGVEAAMISVFAESGPARMRTLAAWLEGRPLRGFEYALEQTPCAGVVGREFRYVCRGARDEFAPGTLFREKGFDSYSAYSLNDTTGRQLGLIAVMDRKPLPAQALTEATLKLFAMRAVAELERTRSEASYRAIFDASEDPILVHDWASGAVVEVSAKAGELYGYSREEMRRISLADLSANVPPYTEREAARLIEKAKTQPGPLRFEWRTRHKDGRLMWHEVTLKAVTLAGQRRILAFVRDITERRGTEEALRASEAQYRAIFNAVADSMVLRDAEFRVVDVNPAYEAMSGRTRAEALGRDGLTMSPPELNAQVRGLHARALAGEPVGFEARARRKNGETFDIETRGVPILHEGRPHVLYIGRDITLRKREQELLRTSEEQYRAIFDASADALVLWDSELKRVDVNPAYERIYGFTREEVLSHTYAQNLPADYVERRRDLVRRTLAGEPCQVELESVRKDGTRIQVEVRTIPIQHRGKPHVLAISRDVTRRRGAEEALRASEEQYRAIFNATADALALRDAEFRIVDANAAYEAMTGRRRADAIGQVGLTISNDPGVDRPALHARALAGEPLRIETEGRRPDGTPLVLEVRGVPVTHRGKPHVLYIGRDITARKAAEQALRASEAQYRAIFNASSDAMVLWDSQLRRVDVNAAYERMFGWTREEVVGHSRLNEGTSRDYAKRRLQLVRRALEGRSGHAELEAVRKSGEPVVVEASAIPFMQGSEQHVLVTLRDVTERRRAEEALRASEEQYRAIFNAAADALVLRDADFRIVDVNRAYEAMSGYARREVLGRDHVVANPPDMDAKIKALHARALAGEPVMTETVRVRKDGSRAEIELRGVPIQYRASPHVLYIGRDISERKRAEQALRGSEEQYRAIFNAAADAMVLRDAQFRIVDVNPAFCALTGYARDDIIAARHTMGNSPQLDETLRDLHRQALAGTAAQVETVGMRIDGSRFDLEIRAVPIQYQGRPHVLFVGRNISERKALEARLRQGQKMEALGQLSGGVAHDFNNLLASIMGYVVLALERTGDADPKLASHLEQALASCRRARDLIQQMLTFSRGQRGAPRPIALPALVAESLKLLRASLPATLEIATRTEETPAVMLDPVQLEQVLMNLLINARDATAGVGRIGVAVHRAALRAKVTCASCRKRFRGDFVELAVADSGAGIGPAVLERMFEPFFTTKEVGRGSGMGLATVHGIVHEHRGHVVVDSAPGEGSRFRIFFPALPGGAADAAAGVKAARVERRAPLRGRVLVVDDEEAVAGFMRELLESWGLAVTAVTNPLGVLERVSRSGAFDLVILDQTMPGITGLTLARELSAVLPALPILLYTGRGDRIAAAELASAGVRAMLHKPVEPDELYRLLRSHLH